MNSGIFEGGFRRLPEQNLAGASRNPRRGDFLQKVLKDRERRQLILKQTKCAIQIQALVRGHLTRRRLQCFREDFIITRYTALCSREISLPELGQYITTYYFLNSSHHYDLLIWLAKQITHYRVEIISDFASTSPNWIWRIRWVLKMLLSNFNSILDLQRCQNSRYLHLVPHVFDIYTKYDLLCSIIDENSVKCYLQETLLYMVHSKFFEAIKCILHIDDPRRFRFNDDSALITYVQQVLCRPFNLITSASSSYANEVVKHLSKAFLVDQASDKTKAVVFPVLTTLRPEAKGAFIEGILYKDVVATPSTLHLLIDIFRNDQNAKFCYIIDAFSVLIDRIPEEFEPVLPTDYLDSSFETESIDDEDETPDPDINVPVPKKCVDSEMLNECLNYIKSFEFSRYALECLDNSLDQETIMSLSRFLHVLIINPRFKDYKILWYAALHPTLYKELWNLTSSLARFPPNIEPKTFLTLIQEGELLEFDEASSYYPVLISFCFLFKRFFCMLKDEEISDKGNEILSFSYLELMELTYRLKEVAASILRKGMPDGHIHLSEYQKKWNQRALQDCYVAMVNLLKVLHAREINTEQSFWIASFSVTRLNPKFNDWNIFNKPLVYEDNILNNRNSTYSNRVIRPLVMLRDLPFCIDSRDRLNLLHDVLSSYKHQYQHPCYYNPENTFIKIRRDHIYDDAFVKLSPSQVPEVRINLKIQLISAMGYDEAGIDGGGIFKEFMVEFLRAAFDPSRGFFLANEDHKLYPNPNVEAMYTNYRAHYFFIGRMLAKALYEDILVELPLAEFFLAKLVRKDSKDINLYELNSLDSQLFRNLIYLRSFDGDFSNLALNYTVVSGRAGDTKVIELIPDGERISVNNSNKLDYIGAVADYKLNSQIETQCTYFRQGIASVISIFWLAIFSAKELHKLILCWEKPIDTRDLRMFCIYSGGYSNTHPNIEMFWNVIESFEDQQKRQLLSFVTSCSRQPLLGFMMLDPPFTIHLVDSNDRLPTASTCMNLLKLPIFPDEEVMREKLLYSIQSQSGFDLC